MHSSVIFAIIIVVFTALSIFIVLVGIGAFVGGVFHIQSVASLTDTPAHSSFVVFTAAIGLMTVLVLLAILYGLGYAALLWLDKLDKWYEWSPPSRED